MFKVMFGSLRDKKGNYVDESGKTLNKKKTNSVVKKTIVDKNSNKENNLNINSISSLGTKSGLSKKNIEILKKCAIECTAKELRSLLGFSNANKFKKNYLDILINFGYMEPINPKFILKKDTEVKRDLDGVVARDEKGKMIYIDKVSEIGEIMTKKCLVPNPHQKYKLTGKFVRNKI